MAKVGIVMGSDSDMPVMAKAADILEKLGVDYEMTIISAHREPDVFFQYAKTAEEKGFKVIAAVATLAEHSIMRRFAAGRPDEEDIKVLEDFGAKISSKIEAGAGDMTDFEIPGNRPYKELKVASLMPEVDGSKCIGCKLCARICPVGAIDEKATTETDSSLCIGCNRCIYYCPKKARSLNPEKLAALEEKVGAALSGRKESELYI